MKTKRQLSRNHGWLFKLTWPVTHYLITHFFVTVGWIFFKFFNRTIVIGKENIPFHTHTLLLSNHQSMIDSFPVGLFAYFPGSLIRPKLIPWNPAAEENFYRNPFFGWIADNWKCIPIKKGRKDLSAIYKMAEALETSPLILFPEGTRSRDGEIGKPHGGAGMLILETNPTVIPVCIDGMDKLLPIGSIFPKLFKRIYVYYGKPIDLSRFCSSGNGKKKETAHEIMNFVMATIRNMRTEIEAMKAEKGVFEKGGLLAGKKGKSAKPVKTPKTV